MVVVPGEVTVGVCTGLESGAGWLASRPPCVGGVTPGAAGLGANRPGEVTVGDWTFGDWTGDGLPDGAEEPGEELGDEPDDELGDELVCATTGSGNSRKAISTARIGCPSDPTTEGLP